MARPKGNRKEARISVSFDSGDFAAVRDLARRNNVSVAWVVRHAVHTLVAGEREILHDDPQLQLPRRAARQTRPTGPRRRQAERPKTLLPPAMLGHHEPFLGVAQNSPLIST